MTGKPGKKEKNKQADALANSEETYRTIADFTYDWEYWLATDGTFIYTSPSCERITGYRPEEFLRDASLLVNITHPDDRSRVQRHLEAKERRDKQDTVQEMEFRIITRNGEERWIHHACQSVFSHDGKYRGCRASNRDITKRRQAEEALRESEEKFHNIFNLANDAIHIHEIQEDGLPGRFIDVNNVACERLLYTREELLAKGPLDFTTTYHSIPVKEIGDLLKSKGFARFETEHRRKDGVIIPVEVNARVITLQNKPVVVSVIRDITERKQAEKALRESEEFNRGLVENLPDFIVIYDRKGIIRYANTASLKMIGSPASKVIGEPVISFIADYQRSDVEKNMKQRFSGAQVGPYELDLRTVTGGIVTVLIQALPITYRKDTVMLALMSDITERKRTEETLVQSQRQFSDIINFLPDATLVIDNKGEVIAWNRAMEEMTGVLAEQMIGKANYEYALPFYHKRRPILVDVILTRDKKALERYPGFQWAGDTLIAETFIPHFNNGRGSYLWFAASVLYGSDGKPAGAIESVRDITERKKIEDDLRKTYADYQHLLGQIQDVYYKSDAEGRLILASRSWAVLLGYDSLDECIGKFIARDFYADPNERAKFLDAVKHDGKVTDYEITLRKKDGSPVPVATSSHFYTDDNGTILGVEGTLRDITERKRMERELIESQQHFHNIINFLPDATFAIDENGTVIAWNQAIERMTGVLAEQIIGKGNYEYALPFYHERRQILVDLIRNDDPITIKRYPNLQRIGNTLVAETFIPHFNNGKGAHIWFTASSLYDQDGKPKGAIESIRDITDRKNAESALLESGRRLNDIINFLPDPTFVIDTDGMVIAWNRAIESLLGVPADEVIGKGNYEHAFRMFGKRRPVLVDLVIHGDEAVMKKHYPNLHKEGSMLTAELEIASLKGRRRVLWITATPLYDAQGKVAGAIESLRDITAIRETERELTESQQRLNDIINFLPDPTYAIDADGKVIAWNRAIESLLEVPADEVIGKGNYEHAFRMFGKRRPVLVDLVIHGDEAVMKKHYPTLQMEGSMLTAELEIASLKGRRRVLWIIATPLIDNRGKITGAIESMRDITRIHDTEIHLRESEQRLNDIINFLPDPTYAIDADGKVIAWNRAIESLLGVPADEVIGKGNYEHAFRMFGKRRPVLVDLVIHGDEAVMKKHYPNLHKEGSMLTAELEIASLKGRRRVLWITATPLYNAQGKVAGAIESLRDVTHIRDTEHELQQLNTELEQRVRERTAELQLTSDALRVASNYNRSLFEADMDPLIMVRPDGIISDVNSAGERMTGLNRTEIIGTPLSQYTNEPEQAIVGFREVLEKGSSTGHEYGVLHRDGYVTPVMTSSILLKEDNGAIKGVFISLHDMSQIKEDEQIIMAQLREKEILLREVHHRVKNNLQIVVSLINLQTRTVSDAGILATLRDIQNRIKAISIVHERLYLSSDVARIDFGAYARNLTTNLFGVYRVDPKRVAFRVDAQDVFLDIDTATPLGLILNELISNTLKYAFPNERKGEFVITAQQDAGALTLVVKDNGVGIAEGIDWQNTRSLGLQLIRILTEQLRGTVTLDQSSGTAFTLCIPFSPKSTDIHYVEGS